MPFVDAVCKDGTNCPLGWVVKLLLVLPVIIPILYIPLILIGTAGGPHGNDG